MTDRVEMGGLLERLSMILIILEFLFWMKYVEFIFQNIIDLIAWFIYYKLRNEYKY